MSDLASQSQPAVPHNILCADDNLMVCRTIEYAMHRAGYGIVCVHDGRDALALLQRDAGRFDVLITDYEMPELNGLELVRAVRRSGLRLAIIVISGNLSPARIDEFETVGVSRVIEKPFLPSVIISAIQSLGPATHLDRSNETQTGQVAGGC